MCLIVDKPPGVEIPAEILYRGLEDNPDGWGIMFVADGAIRTVCGLREKDFERAYLNSWQDDLHMSIHFRWATHGSKTEKNCHPFPILKGRYTVMHNGVISVPITQKDRSDTWHYANNVLAPLLEQFPDAFGTEMFQRVLEQSVGGGNKLIILRNDGARMFLNREAGLNYEGLWLSNSGPLAPAWGYKSDAVEDLGWDDDYVLKWIEDERDAEIHELYKDDEDYSEYRVVERRAGRR